MRRSWAAGGLGLVLSLLVLVGCSGSSNSQPPNTAVGVVADSGFTPTTNGFSFQNYGAELSDGAIPINLTAADVEKMFGDAVCVDAKLRLC
ncbi:MAG TPA: hypothetical protein VLX59_05775, partial [Acidimicrobiales bacterium]|nr:hypothetical protein [Acidimicrobiales bacterium]